MKRAIRTSRAPTPRAFCRNGIGLVNPSAFQTLRHAIDTGTFAAFESVILGGTRTLNGPLAGNAFSLEGCDAVQFGNARSPANQIASRGPTRAGPRERCLRHGTGGTLLGFAAPGCRVYRLRFKSYRRAGCGRAGHHAHVRRPEEWVGSRHAGPVVPRTLPGRNRWALHVSVASHPHLLRYAADQPAARHLLGEHRLHD
jgi:hypothetical protein